MEKMITDALPDTLGYGGCTSIEVMRAADDPNAWALVEEW